jgi:ribosomal protein S18 acetylase RimI-like enzyme
MMAPSPDVPEPDLMVEHLKEFTDHDLATLCEATDAAIIDGGGFGWVNPPGRRALETGDIVGSAILVRPPRNNEAQAFAASLMHAYVAPYARGYGLARRLTRAVEERARELGYHILNLDVRETQTAAIRLYQSMGYIRWGEHPEYAFVRGQPVTGFFYYKRLRPLRTGGGGIQ